MRLSTVTLCCLRQFVAKKASPKQPGVFDFAAEILNKV
jgi:hypothetical protein